MNLYLRLFWTILVSKYKSKISILDEFTSNHIAWPNDLDLFGHINNGRYFTITDYVRIGCLIRAGIWKNLRRRKIFPLMAGETAQFRRPLRLFQKYQIKTRTVGWDERFLYVEHRFVTQKGVHAVLLVKVVFVSSDKSQPSPAEILKSVQDEPIPQVNISEFISNWNASSDSHWSKTEPRF